MNEAIQRVLARRTDIEIAPYSDAFRSQAVAIGREMHAGSIYRDMRFDEAKLLRQLAASGGVVPDRYFRLAVRKGEVLGGFYGHVTRTFFCDDLLAQDMGWWVKKAARGGPTALLLLADFERWSRERGASKIMVGQSTEIDIERTTRLFAHCGFRVIGFNTVKDL